jgi:glycosyltransferase involved in cell wall biosynthesis
LSGLVDSAGLSDVRLPGEVDDPAPLLAAAAISALLTDNEGMPNAVLKSWSTGTPVIASRAPGVSSLVRDEVDGLLVDNTAQAWAAGLLRLLREPQLRARLAQARRECLEREFSIEPCAMAWAKLYHRVVEQKQQAGSR